VFISNHCCYLVVYTKGIVAMGLQLGATENLKDIKQQGE
jgi:hypothetical protein